MILKFITTAIGENAKQYDDKTYKKYPKFAERSMCVSLLSQSSNWYFLLGAFATKDYNETQFVNRHSKHLRLADFAGKVDTGGKNIQIIN